MMSSQSRRRGLRRFHGRPAHRPVVVAIPITIATAALAGPIPAPSLRITSSEMTTFRYGEAVAIAGDIALVGAPGDTQNGMNSGAVYAYHRQPDGSWLFEQKLTPMDPDVDDLFGFSIDLISNVAVIGAYRDNDNGTDSGSAYAFRREANGAWVQEDKLLPLDGSTLDRFGYSVSIGVGQTGFEACIGAHLDDAAGPDSGSVYIFTRDFSGAWTESDKFTGIDTEDSDSFGWSVGFDNSTAVIGAFLDDDQGIGAGAVYIFQRDLMDNWVQVQKIVAPDGHASDNFGISVDIEDELIAIGAYLDDDRGVDSGSVYLYRFGGIVWSQEIKLTAPDGVTDDLFGRYVDVQGGRVIVGAPGKDTGDMDAGAAYVFNRVGSQWLLNRELFPTSPALGGEFGHDVAIDGETALVGAWREAGVDPQGAAYLFDLSQFGCVGDLNADDLIDTADLGILLSVFGSSNPTADLNGDGVVDTADLGSLLAVFGDSCPP